MVEENGRIGPCRQRRGGLANDAYKARCGAWFWGSIALASVLHFLFFTLGPAMTVSGPSGDGSSKELEYVNLPPDVKLPPPPDRVDRPDVPVVAELEVPEDFEIEPIRFDEFEFTHIPAPPAAGASLNGRPNFRDFAPYMVEPNLTNRSKVLRELSRRFPRALRAVGVDASVVIWFWIDEEGRVADYEVKVSSGYASVDKAATSAAEIMEFTPALHGDRPVAVMVALPITFEVR